MNMFPQMSLPHPLSPGVAHHVDVYTALILNGAADLNLSTIAAYLQRAAFEGCLSAKLPSPSAFRRWVVQNRVGQVAVHASPISK